MQDTESIYVQSAAELAARLACVHRPVAAMFDIYSGNGGDAFELIEIAQILRKHPYPTKAVIRGVAPLLGAVGAQNVSVEPGSYVLVAPLKMTTAGTAEEMAAQAAKLEAVDAAQRKELSRWPGIAALLDDGQDHWLSAEEFAALAGGDAPAAVNLTRVQDVAEQVSFVRVQDVTDYGAFAEPGDKTKLGPQE